MRISVNGFGVDTDTIKSLKSGNLNSNNLNQTREVKKASKGQAIAIGLLFFVIGVFTLFFGFKNVSSYNEKVNTYISIDGVVVDRTVDYDDDNTLYSSIVEYEVNGTKYTVKENTKSSVTEEIGSKMEVLYNPEKPSDAIIVKDAKGGNTLIFVVGGVFTVFGFIMFVSGLLMKKENS